MEKLCLVHSSIKTMSTINTDNGYIVKPQCSELSIPVGLYLAMLGILGNKLDSRRSKLNNGL